MQDISKCLLPFDEDATVENLQSELSVGATHWDTLKKSPLSEYKVRLCQPVVSEMEEDGSQMEMEQEEVDLVSKRCATCKNCALCCFLLLQQLSMFTHAYHTIGLAYKFLLTLSCTQVACERSFSILKFIQHRLRSRLSQDNLEALMLMATEKEILINLDSDDIIISRSQRECVCVCSKFLHLGLCVWFYLSIIIKIVSGLVKVDLKTGPVCCKCQGRFLISVRH